MSAIPYYGIEGFRRLAARTMLVRVGLLVLLARLLPRWWDAILLV